MSVNISSPAPSPVPDQTDSTTLREQRRESLRERPPLSRPLSEISINETRWRSNRSSVHSSKSKRDKGSQPASEVKEDTLSGPTTNLATTTKRMCPGINSLPQTLTVNLTDYASKAQPSPTAHTSDSSESKETSAPGVEGRSPPDLPKRSEDKSGAESYPSYEGGQGDSADTTPKEGMVITDNLDKGQSTFLMAQRNSLRSVSGPASYADAARPTLAPGSDTEPSLSAGAQLAPPKPPTKTKPSWLKRANGAAGAALRTKTKSPAQSEDSPGSPTKPLPPMLPPRREKGKVSASVSMADMHSLLSQSTDHVGPPECSSKTSYASVASSAPLSSQPPPLPPRDNIGNNIRGRIAAWTSVAQNSSVISRSESTQSLAAQSMGGPRGIPHSASRAFGHAGSAVSKGWAGLKSRGMGTSMSISNLNALAQPSARPSSRVSPLGGKGKEKFPDIYEHQQAGPSFTSDMFKRPREDGDGKVFGKELVDLAKTWGVVDMDNVNEGQTEWEGRRKKYLPAVVIRTCDYLHIWGPKEEGIFRISGRSSHLVALKKEFDGGADLDLTECHPGDLDPHSVAGTFKTYIRELPSPILTKELGPKFEEIATRKKQAGEDEESARSLAAEFDALLLQLPQAHWFLLAEIVKLLELIPRHSDTNRMTLRALMLSLGPSLNIPGVVVTELMERRETLFNEPPPPSPFDTAHELINFGDVDIGPVVPPSAKSSTFSIDSNSEDSGSRGRKPTKLPSRPSITKLFTSSIVSLPRQRSLDALSGGRDNEAPRVDLTVSPTSLLPEFGGNSPDATPTRKDQKRDTVVPSSSTNPPSSADTPTIATSSLAKEQHPLDEVHYAPGTVEDRAKMFTPIADKYTAGHSTFTSLRGSSDSSSTLRSRSTSCSAFPGIGDTSRPGSSMSIASGANPATVIRRGQPVFFQSAGVEGSRHARSVSSLSSINLQDNNKGLPTGVGHKRKDETIQEGEEDGRGKRLSAGPGMLDDLTV